MTSKELADELDARTWSFSAQFRDCNATGICEHMSKANHDAMPKAQQRAYAKHRKFMGYPDSYFGPRGPLFCGITPGVCSSKHCPLKPKRR